MGNAIARGLSYLFHPLLIPTWGLFFVFQLNSYLTYQLSEQGQWFLYLLTFTFTFIAPAFSSFYLYKIGMLSSLHIEKREERWLPFLVTALFYGFTYYLLNRINLPSAFHAMILAASISVGMALIITLWWKISIHMVGIGGLLGIVYLLAVANHLQAQLPLILILLLSGCLGYARLKLEAHNLKQLAGGFVMGFAATSLTLYLFLVA